MTPADAKKTIENFITEALNSRSDKSWTPNLFASSDIAELCPVIGGFTVVPDKALKQTIEIRLAPVDFARLKSESPLHVVNDVAVKLEGVRTDSVLDDPILNDPPQGNPQSLPAQEIIAALSADDATKVIRIALWQNPQIWIDAVVKVLGEQAR